MKQKSLFIISFLSVLLCFASCQKEEQPNQPDNPNQPSAKVEIEITNTTATTISVSFTPAEGVVSYSYMIGEDGDLEQYIPMFGSIEAMVKAWGITETSASSHTFTDLTPNKPHTIYCVVKTSSEEMITKETATQSLGDNGLSKIALDVDNIQDSSVVTHCTPNSSTASYKYLLVTQHYFDSVGQEGVITLLKEDYYVFYEESTWTWMALEPGTPYFLVAIGKNAADEWGEFAKKEFTTTGTPSAKSTTPKRK